MDYFKRRSKVFSFLLIALVTSLHLPNIYLAFQISQDPIMIFAIIGIISILFYQGTALITYQLYKKYSPKSDD